ncbi:hypothetical protein [Cupriavidus necator]|uniref:hypothetical protein n=1 Tax=Cupriavidus necator TaxID=106590 RepID=UPI00339D5EA1
MTRQRADQMMADLPRYLQPAAWPNRVGLVMLAGGAEYRRVMRAALARGTVPNCLPCKKPLVASACSGRNSALSSAA